MGEAQMRLLKRMADSFFGAGKGTGQLSPAFMRGVKSFRPVSLRAGRSLQEKEIQKFEQEQQGILAAEGTYHNNIFFPCDL